MLPIKRTIVKKLLIAIILVLPFCQNGNAEEKDFISVVDFVNSSGEYVVIHAGLNQGIKVGDEFTLSREYFVTANVVVSQVMNTTCQARGSKRTSIKEVLPGDKALLLRMTPEETRDLFLFRVQLISIAIATLLVAWFIHRRARQYVVKHNLLALKFFFFFFKCLNVWFWFLFLSSAFIILMITQQAFIDGLHIQDIMLVYPFVWILLFLTFSVALVGIIIARIFFSLRKTVY